MHELPFYRIMGLIWACTNYY